MQQAGAKYCVFVTKHHPDGFCMFDSAPAGIRPRHPARIGFLNGPLP